jgi:hypothetical protein
VTHARVALSHQPRQQMKEISAENHGENIHPYPSEKT